MAAATHYMDRACIELNFIQRAAAKILQKSINSTQVMPAYKLGRAVKGEWDYKNAVKHGYNRSAIVYSCINLIAKSAASVQWKTYKRQRGGTWEEVIDHPLTLLIEKPNPFMSQKDFIERMTHSLYLGGNSIFSKVRGTGNTVLELWYLPQTNIKPVPDQKTFISHYEYNAEGIKRNIKTADILHNQFLNPDDLFWGIAPIKAAAEIIDTDNEAIAWNRHSMQQRAISDGAFIIDQPLTEDQWKEARQQITEQHTGSDNARSFWVLGAGAQWQPMSMTPAEMDFIESRKLNREEICSIFGVPPVMVGLYENATLANIETGRKIFWLDTIIPYLSDIRNCLNASLAAEYGTDIKLDFDTSTVEAIQENIQDKIANATSLFSMGVPFNEINKKLDLGFDEIEGGEVGYLAANLIPANAMDMQQQQEEATNAQNEPPSDQQDEPKDESNTNTAKSLKNITAAEYEIESNKRFFSWKAVERKRLPYDMAMTRKAARIFEEMGEEVAKAYEKGGVKAASKKIDSYEAQWRALYEGTYKNIFEDIGKSELNELLSAAKSFDPRAEEKAKLDEIIDKSVLSWIFKTCAKKVTGVLDFTKSKIAALIHDLETEYQQEGYRVHTDKVAKGIKEEFTEFSRYRSYRIARTEVAGASNAATHKAQQVAQKQLGNNVVIKRQWLSSRDDRVRDSHKHMDGQIVGLDEPFTIYTPEGQPTERKLNYPADYEADEPAETIHCRCATKPIIEKA
jgi:HK97 family phage portal protein